MRTIKPFNDEGFKFIEVVRKSTVNKTGTFLVECPKCHSQIVVYANTYYRNRIRCHCELNHKRLYSIYTNMKTRCYNESSPNYKYYGGRGITITNEWLNNFQNFYTWAIQSGYADNLTIDRIDVNGNYEPNNCRWISREEQAKNKTNTVKTKGTSLRSWCIEHGLNYKTVHTYKTRHPEKSIEEIIQKFVELEESQCTDMPTEIKC